MRRCWGRLPCTLPPLHIPSPCSLIPHPRGRSWGREPFPTGENWKISPLRKCFCFSLTFLPLFTPQLQAVPFRSAGGSSGSCWLFQVNLFVFPSFFSSFSPIPLLFAVLDYANPNKNQFWRQEGQQSWLCHLCATPLRGGFVPSLSWEFLPASQTRDSPWVGSHSALIPKIPHPSWASTSPEKGNFPGELGWPCFGISGFVPEGRRRKVKSQKKGKAGDLCGSQGHSWNWRIPEAVEKAVNTPR